MADDSTSIVLYPKKSTAVLMLILCSAFVAIGIWMGMSKDWIGYLRAGFFALGIPVAVVQLLPGSSYLEIEQTGFTFCSLFRKTSIPWSAIDSFGVFTLKQSGMKIREMVGFNYAPTYDRAKFGRSISKALTGCEGALPETYGKKAEELAALLNRCLDTMRLQDHLPPAPRP